MKNRKIRIIHLKDPARQKSPWMVRYYEGRKPVREFYSTEPLAKTRKKELSNCFFKGLNPKEMARINRLLAGTGYNPTEVVKVGLRTLRENGSASASPSALFRTGTEMVLQRAEGNTSLAPVTLQNYRFAYSHINRTFGDRTAISITSDEVIAFLDSLKNSQRVSGSASVATKRTYTIMFRMALKILGIENPLKEIPRYKTRSGPVRFYTVDQVRTMFEHCPARERGLLALAVFGVLRPELLGKLDPSFVDVSQRTVYIPEYLAKDRNEHMLEGEVYRTDNNHYVPGLPDVVWEWLRIYPFEPTTWINVRLRLKRVLKGFWIHDGLRKTGATYYHKLHGKVATSALLTHEGEDLAFKHYVGAALLEEADKFYALVPSCIVFRPERARYAHLEQMPREAIVEKIWNEPMSEVARELGCSVAGLYQYCVRHNIERPGAGYWTALRYRCNHERN